MRNTFTAVYYVGDVDVTVQFAHNSNGWSAVAVGASDEDWAQHSMQQFNELVLNKFTQLGIQCQQQLVAQNLLHVVSVYEPELEMELASVNRCAA